MLPHLPLEVLLLIADHAQDLQTLASLSLTCRLLHAHIGLPRLKIFYLVGTEQDNDATTLSHLSLTCKRLHSLLAPLLEGHRKTRIELDRIVDTCGGNPTTRVYQERWMRTTKAALLLWMALEWRRVLRGGKGQLGRRRALGEVKKWAYSGGFAKPVLGKLRGWDMDISER